MLTGPLRTAPGNAFSRSRNQSRTAASSGSVPRRTRTVVVRSGGGCAAFALDQFRRRADRDGASLVILATHHLRLRPGEPSFDRLRAIAGELRIPVVSLHDHIVRRGGRVRDAHWRHDRHWTPASHEWAAEAILEHLRRRPDVCARGPRRTPRRPGPPADAPAGGERPGADA